ncbi:tetratricopeptide repeat protein [Dokdonella sp.]|uniref:tetratricopeptide repeat protein n=1 Tax=Dokdonella sp. TaxID=2291710 RepID=UPI003527A2C5
MTFASRNIRAIAISCFVLASVACSSPSEPETAVLVRPEAEPASVSAVKAIRAVGADEESVLQINPLRDPAVEGFLAEAARAEETGQFDVAFVAISKARNLAPDAPDLLQYEAEIEFLRGNTIEAEKRAYESFKNGPQIGRLCQQNWQTILEARKVFNDNDYLPYAESKRDACRAKRPVRL